jgi:adenylate kinase family enzyme
VKRIVVLGRGASGKSSFSRALSEATAIPRVELDQVFWSPDLSPKAPDEWRELQADLTEPEAWILDGDLGPYDAPETRLARADAIVLFDLGFAVCAWRALRRSRERFDFWQWLVTWRRHYRPETMRAVATSAPDAQLFVVRNDRDRNYAFDRIVNEARGDASR